MSSRIVRRQTFLSKLRSCPFDVYLYLNEITLSVEWDELVNNVALPLGISLCSVILFMAKTLAYYDSVNLKLRNIVFSSSYRQYEQIKQRLASPDYASEFSENLHMRSDLLSSVMKAFRIIQILLFLGTGVASFYVLNASKTYTLFNCTERPSIGSVQKSKLNAKLWIDNFFDFLGFDQLVDLDGGDFQDTTDFDEIMSVPDKQVYQIKSWDPSKFGIFLLIGYNPINVALIELYSKDLPIFKLLFLYLIFTASVYLIVNKFLLKLEDKQLLYQEMLKEYNEKYVKPKTTILKKDAMIDSTMGPFDSTVLIAPEPFLFNKLKVFITHDIDGNTVKNLPALATKTSDIFPRSQTYRQLQVQNNVDEDSMSYQHENNDLKRKIQHFERQLEYMKSINDTADFDDIYSASTPYIPPPNRTPGYMSNRHNVPSPSSRGLNSSRLSRSPENRRSPSPTRTQSLRMLTLQSRSPQKFKSELSPTRPLARNDILRSPSRTPSPAKNWKY